MTSSSRNAKIMSDIAIRVENLSKRYRIGAKQEAYRTLREAMMSAVSAPARQLRAFAGRSGAAAGPQEFWALNDVSFEVKRGEVVGIIGRNGAGKSTLLKILSRITEPTSGSVDIYGRVGSLLEVGTGFHPELTGRENIYLNGAILGMKRDEIARQFDAIVEFAEIEKFVDTPVKHYSSGMYLRLAFAVAAHLEPEILLVDEVLAVGDAAFQKKCLGKMGAVAKEGRTVLFVSHDLGAIQSLCRRSLLLNGGEIMADGPTEQVVYNYIASKEISGNASRGYTVFNDEFRNNVRFNSVKTMGCDGNIADEIRSGDGIIFEIELESEFRIIKPFIDILFKDEMDRNIAVISSYFGHKGEINIDGLSQVRVEIGMVNLVPGNYYIDMFIHSSNQRIALKERAICVQVIPSDFLGTGKMPPKSLGPVCFQSNWEYCIELERAK